MLHPLKLGSVNHWSMENIREDVKLNIRTRNMLFLKLLGDLSFLKGMWKSLLSVIPRYYRRPNYLNMLARSIVILYDDQKQGAEKFI